MKKYYPIWILIFFILFTSSSFCLGQENNGKKDLTFGIKINPVSLLVGSISISGEYFVQKQNTFQLGLQYFTGYIPIVHILSYSRMAGISGSFRHYNNKNIRKSTYLEPFFRNNLVWHTSDEGESFQAFALGFILGKQWIKKTNRSFEIFAGPYYSKPYVIGLHQTQPTSKDFTEKEGNPYYGFWIRAGITIGGFH